MLAQVRDHLQATWRRVTSSTASALPLLSASEQTRLSWAKPVESYAAVPDAFKSFFEPYRAMGREFPYTVLTPSYEAFIFRTTEKLICDLGSQIVVLEKSGNTYNSLCYPLDGISYVEVRSVLLDSRIKITGEAGQGAPITSTLRFNAVTDYLFIPFLEKIRLGDDNAPVVVSGSEAEKFENWIHLSYKFMNYASRSLLDGEKVRQAVFQPEIRAAIFTIFGKTLSKSISPALAAILTDREMILIREDNRQIGGGRYGGVWNYIPLNKVLSLCVDKREGNLIVLSIQLPYNARMECLFADTARAELDCLLLQYREGKG